MAWRALRNPSTAPPVTAWGDIRPSNRNISATTCASLSRSQRSRCARAATVRLSFGFLMHLLPLRTARDVRNDPLPEERTLIAADAPIVPTEVRYARLR